MRRYRSTPPVFRSQHHDRERVGLPPDRAVARYACEARVRCRGASSDGADGRWRPTPRRFGSDGDSTAPPGQPVVRPSRAVVATAATSPRLSPPRGSRERWRSWSGIAAVGSRSTPAPGAEAWRSRALTPQPLDLAHPALDAEPGELGRPLRLRVLAGWHRSTLQTPKEPRRWGCTTVYENFPLRNETPARSAPIATRGLRPREPLSQNREEEMPTLSPTAEHIAAVHVLQSPLLADSTAPYIDESVDWIGLIVGLYPTLSRNEQLLLDAAYNLWGGLPERPLSACVARPRTRSVELPGARRGDVRAARRVHRH